MEVLPAIDLRGGQVVRLAQGDYDRQTAYSDDPVAVAESFVSAGAAWIHVVDLDAARTGRFTSTAIVGDICRAVSPRGVKVEFGGGVRDSLAIETMRKAGVARVVIGSAAVKNWAWFEGLLQDQTLGGASLALGLDARGGCLAAEGWSEQLSVLAVDLARRVRGSGLGAIVYTDIARDGMLTGANLRSTADLIAETDVPVVASGGVASIDDVLACRQIGCAGVIVGRAWYEGKIDLHLACELAKDLS